MQVFFDALEQPTKPIPARPRLFAQKHCLTDQIIGKQALEACSASSA
jgi:hypothetical protein